MRNVNLENQTRSYITREGWHTVKITKVEYQEDYDSYRVYIKNRDKETTFVSIPLAENRLFILANLLKAMGKSLTNVDLDNLAPVLEGGVVDLNLEYYVKTNAVTGERETSKFLSIKGSRKATPKEDEPKVEEKVKLSPVENNDDLPF